VFNLSPQEPEKLLLLQQLLLSNSCNNQHLQNNPQSRKTGNPTTTPSTSTPWKTTRNRPKAKKKPRHKNLCNPV